MRDGVKLYATLYRPLQGERFPTLLIRSPYSTQHPRYMDWAKRFVQSGYAVVMQDCRGRYESEGEWQPYVCETNDGLDTYQWVSAQPWCDGHIGTFGVSYPGFTQILPAPFRHPAVQALVPIAHQEDNYGHLRYNGVLQLQNTMNFLRLGRRQLQTPLFDHVGWLDLSIYRRLPLLTALDDLGERPFYREMIRHNEFDEFWSAYSMKGKYGEVAVPAYFITGWYDNLMHEGFKVFTAWKREARTSDARKQTRMMIGPWTHSFIGSAAPFGEVDFGASATVDMAGEHLRWYDRRLKGIDNGIDDEPPIRLFVMGRNVWRGEHEWPLARTQWTKFYLHSDGCANSLNGDGTLTTTPPASEPHDAFTYNPDDPVPTLGGQSMFIENTGPKNRRPVEQRADVLVYSTAPLAQPVEVTGPIMLTLYAASSAPDTDFTATLVDVHPDGKAIHLCEGIVRARFRESYERPTLIEPSKVYEYTFSLWETSNIFEAGHCIRLEVSSSNFPRFDRNLNTGHTPGLDAELRVAQQAIYHNVQQSSHLTLPVIPA
jgi:hypothetical protein